MSKKKTIKVEELKTIINGFLKDSQCSPDVRSGMITILEEVLFSTGNYNGYRHLLSDDVPAGQLPGINYEKTESGLYNPCADYVERFKNTDATRVNYY